MTRLRFRDEGALFVGMSVLGEASVGFEARGANELDTGDLSLLDDEQRAELVKLVRDPIEFTDEYGNHVVQASPDGMVAALVVPEAAAQAAEDAQGRAVTWVGEQPPRTGPGASRDAWAAFADLNQIAYADGASRDDIIRAVEAHGDR